MDKFCTLLAAVLAGAGLAVRGLERVGHQVLVQPLSLRAAELTNDVEGTRSAFSLFGQLFPQGNIKTDCYSGAVGCKTFQALQDLFRCCGHTRLWCKTL